MATWSPHFTVTPNRGNWRQFDGVGPIDRIDFVLTDRGHPVPDDPKDGIPSGFYGPIAVISADRLAIPQAQLHFAIDGSAGPDHLIIDVHTDTPLLDLSGIAFTDWAPSRGDSIEISFTGGRSHVIGSALDEVFNLVDYDIFRNQRGAVYDATIEGGAGDDSLRFEMARSAIHSTGVDAISDGHGRDVAWSGMEKVRLVLSNGRDEVALGAADDVVYAEDGDDWVSTGAGNDYVVAGLYTYSDGSDMFMGEDGDDSLFGGAGGDSLYGGNGRDFLSGDDGDDLLDGGDGASFLTGGFGSDILRGQGNGPSTLQGGAGRDTLYLGQDDEFDLVLVLEGGGSTGSTRDLVQGFDARHEDRFDLSAKVTSVADHSGGALSMATFGADLAAALDPVLRRGDGSQAILWDPSGGDQGDQGLFLVIDADDDGRYQRGFDYVFELRGLTGTLGLDDFV